ncbi:hypothetical protein Q0F98_24745 [Paenibacillus amylolyticus]|nr:hypothetical protein Q0F98_24745 [Paenibacillus amylolyticus]
MAQVALRKVFRGNGLMSAIFQTSGTNLLVMTLTMLSSILTSRMFGVEGKGAFSAILFWPALLTGLVGFGLPTSIIYNIKQSATEKSAQYVRLSFLFKFRCASSLVLWPGLDYLSGSPAFRRRSCRYPDGIRLLLFLYLLSSISYQPSRRVGRNSLYIMVSG